MKEPAAAGRGGGERDGPSIEELERMRQVAVAQRRAGDVEELDRMIRLVRQRTSGSSRIKVFAAAVVGIAVLIWILWVTDEARGPARPDQNAGPAAAAPAGATTGAPAGS